MFSNRNEAQDNWFCKTDCIRSKISFVNVDLRKKIYKR